MKRLVRTMLAAFVLLYVPIVPAGQAEVKGSTRGPAPAVAAPADTGWPAHPAGPPDKDSAPDGSIFLSRLADSMRADLAWEPDSGLVELKRAGRALGFLVDSPLVLYRTNKVAVLSRPLRLANGELSVPVDALRLVYRELSLAGETWVLRDGALRDGTPIGGGARPGGSRDLFRDGRPGDERVDRLPLEGQDDDPETKDGRDGNSRDGSDRDGDGRGAARRTGKTDVDPSLRDARGPIDVIFLDPGHGGKDPGAIGPRGLREAHVTMRIAEYVEAELRRGLPGVQLVLTRRGDRTVELAERAEIANRLLKQGKKGLFVSIHANASLSPARSGFETYYLTPLVSAGDSRADGARHHGVLEVDLQGERGGPLDGILSRMLVEEYHRESLRMAELIQSGLAARIGSLSENRQVKKANFFVMRCVYMPSVLIEVGFVSNPREGQLLGSAAHQRRVAAGIADGVRNFVHRFRGRQ